MFIFDRSLLPVLAGLVVALAGVGMTNMSKDPVDVASQGDQDARIVADLDTRYQAAVERNDAETMGQILHDEFVLVLGDGRTFTRKDLLRSARDEELIYSHQVEDPGTQVVRVWGDTAVVTARLWLKGRRGVEAVERRLWFTDTYVRTSSGWKYFFGQASLPLPGPDIELVAHPR
jgi:ketosteroid isomerase-like protein